MATNMALKRGRKAQRRKQQVAQKRKAEALEMSLPNRVLRASEAPIQHCLLPTNLFEVGIGPLILARGATPDYLTMGSFLLDVFCLGIKDVAFRRIEGEDLADYLDMTEAQMVAVEPSLARKLLRDLAAWSQSIGFAPHPDFAAAERLFGEVDPHASDAVFRFGRDGKPFYIQGPGDSPELVLRRLAQVQKIIKGGSPTEPASEARIDFVPVARIPA
jgi:hypothetical protein